MALCFDPDDMHWHSGAGQPVRHWHALAHPESGQELCRWLSSTRCVISRSSYRNQTWLNTFWPERGQSATIHHASEIKLVILFWLLAMQSCHIVYGKLMWCHLSVLFVLVLGFCSVPRLLLDRILIMRPCIWVSSSTHVLKNHNICRISWLNWNDQGLNLVQTEDSSVTTWPGGLGLKTLFMVN